MHFKIAAIKKSTVSTVAVSRSNDIVFDGDLQKNGCVP